MQVCIASCDEVNEPKKEAIVERTEEQGVPILKRNGWPGLSGEIYFEPALGHKLNHA